MLKLSHLIISLLVVICMNSCSTTPVVPRLEPPVEECLTI